mgnify:CR=1 FL=1
MQPLPGTPKRFYGQPKGHEHANKANTNTTDVDTTPVSTSKEDVPAVVDGSPKRFFGALKGSEAVSAPAAAPTLTTDETTVHKVRLFLLYVCCPWLYFFIDLICFFFATLFGANCIGSRIVGS